MCINIASTQRHAGLHDPATQALSNFANAGYKVLRRVFSFFLFDIRQIERDKFQIITFIPPQTDCHVMPMEIFGKGFYDSFTDFTWLEQTPHCQPILIQRLQLNHVTAGFGFVPFALRNVSSDPRDSIYLAGLIKNWKGTIPYPAQ